MYDYFKPFQTFLYDVSDTIARSASMLLSRGIKVVGGETPCTDGSHVIQLPQAMKRRLAADEIDFVRYLLHHEAAHIQHSGPPVNWQHKFGHVIHNALEDIRIEKIERERLAGSAWIFNRGHEIALRIWGEHVFSLPPEEVTVHQGVVNAIFGAWVDPSRRTTPTGIEMLDWCMNQMEEFFPEIDSIGEVGSYYLATEDLVPLAERIYKKFIRESPEDSTPSKAAEQMNSRRSGDEDGDPQDEYSHGQFGDGMVEQASASIMAKGGEERVDMEAVDKKSRGFSVGIVPQKNYSAERINDARSNYEWGRRMAAGSTPLINLLRGQSRHSLSRPRDSGIRVHQRSVPDFLHGLTNNVLRRRKKTPKFGTSVVIMVDDSGSMMNEFDRAAWRSAAMLAHACDRAQLRCCVARYSNNVVIEKRFDQSLASASMRFGSLIGNGTNATSALDVSHRLLLEEKTERRVVFFLCDGETQDPRSHIRSIRSDGIEVYPILLGAQACRAAMPGEQWDIPMVAKILDPDKNLASEIITRLCSVC